MAYVSANPNAYLNQSVGSGQCVALVERATGAPHTSTWMPGPVVKGATDLAPGTAIATFDPDGRYGNHTDHRSHAAIYMGQDERGIQVIDQWVGMAGGRKIPHYASPRTIFWADQNPNTAHPHGSDNGDLFRVIQ